jgi:hypothetical protein
MPRDASKLTGKKVKLGVAVATVTADLTAWGDASDYKETSALQACAIRIPRISTVAFDVKGGDGGGLRVFHAVGVVRIQRRF